MALSNIIGYKQINTKGGQSKAYCLALVATYSTGSGKGTVNLKLYIGTTWSTAGYYNYPFDSSLLADGSTIDSISNNREPNKSSDWKTTNSFSYNGKTYKLGALIMSASKTINYGYGVSKTVSCQGVYDTNTTDSDIYLPAAGKFTVSGSVKLPVQIAPAPSGVSIDNVVVEDNSLSIYASVSGDYTDLEYSIDKQNWYATNIFTNLIYGKSYTCYARAKNVNSAYIVSDGYNIVIKIKNYIVSYRVGEKFYPANAIRVRNNNNTWGGYIKRIKIKVDGNFIEF